LARFLKEARLKGKGAKILKAYPGKKGTARKEGDRGQADNWKEKREVLPGEFGIRGGRHWEKKRRRGHREWWAGKKERCHRCLKRYGGVAKKEHWKRVGFKKKKFAEGRIG